MALKGAGVLNFLQGFMFGKRRKIMSENGLEIMEVTDGQNVIRRDITVSD